MCQHYNQQNQQQSFGAQSHFYLHQNHPTPTTIATPAHVTPQPSYHHHQHPQQNGNVNANQHVQHQHQFSYQSPATPTPTPSFMDLDRFNQQAKAFKDQINYFNHQQSKNLRNQINSVHQDGTDPHFDFIVNQNYSDLEKASEQFVNLGNMAAKQNMPKVIKITKTVAVKQPVPIPYPVPVVKVVKEQVPVEQNHVTHHYQHSTPATFTMTSEKTFDFKPSPYYSNYTSYIGKYAPQPQQHSHHDHHHHHNNAVSHTTPSPTPAAMATAHKIAESYIKQEFFSTPASLASIGEYDTRPFYVKTSEKEMIKYIPVPYYVDEHGNRHEVPGTSGSSSSESSSNEDLSSNNYDSYYKQPSSDNHPGKFSSFTFSYHPPSHTTQATPSYHEHSYSTAQPDTKYYYSQGDVASVPISSSADNSVSPSHHYAVSEVDAEDDGSSEHEHTYQYKYVYER